MWMNEWEIDNAIDQWWNDPDVGAAVRTLDNLRAVTNANSDGWAYWPKPARAAGQLMTLIQEHQKWERSEYQLPRQGAKATPAALRKALAPVKAFRTTMIKATTARYNEAQAERWNFLIVERMPTEREELSKKIMDAERTAREHAAAADRWLAEAAELSAKLAELPEDSNG